MGLFSGFAKLFGRGGDPSFEKSCTENYSWSSFFGGSKTEAESFETLSVANQMKTMRNSALVFACVNALATAFQQAPLIVEVKDEGGKWDPRPDHPLLRPFKMHPMFSESEILRYFVSHIETTGSVYLWTIRNGLGQVTEVWPLPPSWVTIHLSQAGDRNKDGSFRVIGFYRVQPPGGRNFDLSNEEVTYVRFPDPSNLWGALSPVVAGSPYIQLEEKSLEFKADSLDSLKLPGPVIKTAQKLTPEQKADLQAVLRRKLGGKGDAAVVLSGEGSTFDLANPAEGFDWNSFSDLDETRVCMVFGVPPVVIGAWVGLKNSPWSNIGEAKRWMYQNTVKGLWDQFSVALTRRIVPGRSQGKIRIAFDLSEISELREDMEAVQKRAVEGFNASILLRSEAREMLGLDALDGDDVYKVSLADSFVVPGEEPEDPEPLTEEENLTDNPQDPDDETMQEGTDDDGAFDNLGEQDAGS